MMKKQVEPSVPGEHLLGSMDATSPFTALIQEDLFDIPVPGKNNMFGSLQILLNTAVGSATLMIPYTYTCGVGLGLIISGIFALLGYLSMHFLIDAAFVSRRYDYYGLFCHCFSAKRTWIMNVAVLLMHMGTLLIYCHWNGKLMRALVGTTGIVIIDTDTFWISMIAAWVVFPLTVWRSVRPMEVFAMLSTVLMLILIVYSMSMFGLSVGNGNFAVEKAQLTIFDMSKSHVIIASFAINSMGFNCHLNLFPCLENLQRSTRPRGRMLAALTMGSAFGLYHIFGLFAYLALFNKLDSGKSVMECFVADRNPFTIFVCIVVMLILIVSAPVVGWSARSSVNRIFCRDEEMTEQRWVGIAGLVVILSSFVASTSSNVIIFFDIVGGLISMAIVLLFPVLFFLKLHQQASLFMKGLAGLTGVFMIGCAIACTYDAISEMIKSSSQPH